MANGIETLECVYYTSPIPSDLSILTFLGLVFDKVHFPNVHIPQSGFDRKDVLKEIARLDGFPAKNFDQWLLRALMRYVLHPELREFMQFTGSDQQVFGGEEMKKCKNLVVALDEQIFGPPKPNFHPMYTPGHHKAVSQTMAIDYPGPLYYQCNALLYAAEHRIPLINSDPSLPVPSYGPQADPKHNAKLLAAIMAMECATLVLPKMGQLQPEQLLEARSDLVKHVRPFRLAMLRMAGKLSSAIGSNADGQELKEAAKFLVHTEVYPTLVELQAELEKPRKGWKSRSWDLVKKTPELAAAYATLNLQVAIPKTLEALGDWIASGVSAKAPRSDLYYLLKLKDAGK